MRRWWLHLHSWLGLSVGVMLSVIALTGSALVYYVDLDRWLHPAGGVVPARSLEPPSYDRVAASLALAYPDFTDGWRLELPDGPGRPLTARYMSPPQRGDRSFAPLMVDLDPQDGRILASRQWGRTVMTWIYDLHMTLLAGQPGRWGLAVMGIACLPLFLGGVILWWPRNGHWAKALSPRLRHGAVRTVYDLHRLAALGGGGIVMLLIVTGVVLVMPSWFVTLPPMHQYLNAEQTDGRGDLGIDQVIGIARQMYPQADLRWIETPGRQGGAYVLRLRQAGEPNRRFPRTMLWIDRHDGRILMQRDPGQVPWDVAVYYWMRPLHDGEAAGELGRIVVCVAGMVPLALLLTGYVRRRQIRAARSKGHSPSRVRGRIAPDADHTTTST